MVGWWWKGEKGAIRADKGAIRVRRADEGSGLGEAAAWDVRAVETWGQSAWERERERYEFA